MKLRKTMKNCLSFGIYLIFMLFIGISKQANAVHISETTCTNSCVVVTNIQTGTTSIEDCCGGRVTTKFLPHPAPEPPNNLRL